MNLIFLSALLEGVQNNDVVAVDRLLQYDNVYRQNFNVNGFLHKFLLHVAEHNNNYEICKMLLKFGADVNIFNLQGHTPLNVVETNMNYWICKLFYKKAETQRKKNLVQASTA